MARLERLGAPCRRDSRCEIRRWDERERRLIMTLSTTFDNIPKQRGRESFPETKGSGVFSEENNSRKGSRPLYFLDVPLEPARGTIDRLVQIGNRIFLLE